MKLLAFILTAAVLASPVFAQDVQVRQLGSGTPSAESAKGTEATELVNDSASHAPQYLPGYPTAATIFPRVVEVPCTKAADGKLNCAGYNWAPNMGRAEYLYITPKVVEAPKPAAPVIVKEPYPVYVEVPVQKKKE
jgi:hypothetical protein